MVPGTVLHIKGRRAMKIRGQVYFRLQWGGQFKTVGYLRCSLSTSTSFWAFDVAPPNQGTPTFILNTKSFQVQGHSDPSHPLGRTLIMNSHLTGFQKDFWAEERVQEELNWTWNVRSQNVTRVFDHMMLILMRKACSWAKAPGQIQETRLRTTTKSLRSFSLPESEGSPFCSGTNCWRKSRSEGHVLHVHYFILLSHT